MYSRVPNKRGGGRLLFFGFWQTPPLLIRTPPFINFRKSLVNFFNFVPICCQQNVNQFCETASAGMLNMDCTDCNCNSDTYCHHACAMIES